MLTFVLLCFLPAFAVSSGVTALMRTVAPRVGLIDQPAARKVHVTPTPLGGGLGIYFGVLLPCLAAWLVAANPSWFAGWVPAELLGGVNLKAGLLGRVLLAGTVLSLVGLLDDRFALPWPPRLLVQFGVAIFLVWSGVAATVFVDAPWVGWLVSVLWIVGLINSLNFLDNMDALSGGIGLIASGVFAAVMLGMSSEPRWLVGGMLLVLAGACAGFLTHNRPKAAIFMGDSGSTFLGMMLATLTLLGTFYTAESGVGGPHTILAPLCVLAVPLYDTLTVTAIRLSEGRSPFHPDKCHFSHRLTDLGLSRTSAVLTVHLATLTTGLGALLLYRVDGWLGASIVLGLVVCMLWIVTILEAASRKGRRKAATGDVRAETSSPADTMPGDARPEPDR